jgi:hypothetical protein
MAALLQRNIRRLGMIQGDAVRFMENVKDVVNELQADHATFKTAVDGIIAKLQGNYIIGVPALAIGSTPTAVATALFHFMIGGKHYIKAAVAAGTAPGNDVIPQALYGAVAFDIGADGTLDAIEATANATGYASAALAVAGLPASAAGHARVGWVTATKSDGAFTFGTTQLDAANTTVAYTAAPTLAEAITDAAPATLSNSTALTLNKG